MKTIKTAHIDLASLNPLAEQSKLEAGSYVSYVIMMAELELPNDSENTEQ